MVLSGLTAKERVELGRLLSWALNSMDEDAPASPAGQVKAPVPARG